MTEVTVKLSLEEKATKEALYQIYKTAKFGLGGHFVVLLIIIFLLFDKVSLNILVSGFILHTVILSWRTYILSQYNKNIHTVTDISNIRHWLRLFKTGAFMSGAAWGITLFFLSELPATHHFFIFAVIVGLAAAGIVTLGVIFSIYAAYMLPILGGNLIWMLLQDGLLYSVAALSTGILIFYYFLSARRFSQNFKQAFIEKETTKEYVTELNILKERMELALLGNNDGLWDWNILDNSLYFSPRWKEMLGYSENELSNEFSTWEDRVHPDSLEAIMSEVQKNVDGETDYYESVYPLKHKDGHWLWVLDRGKAIYDDNGKAVRMIGTHTDITDDREMQLQYARQAQIIKQIHESVISTDLKGIITSWNTGSELLLEYKSDEMIGEHIAGIYLEQDYQTFKKGIDTLMQDEKYHAEVRLVKKSTEVIFADLSLSLLKDEKNKPIGMIGYFQDITERKKAEQKLLEQKNILAYQAHHDALTALPNRVLFNDRLEQSIEKAKRNKTSLALLFIDLDRFKQINDSLGHEIGDSVLKMVTQRLKDTIRKEDTLARLGGDEFTLIMEELAIAQDASLLAQKILDTLAQPVHISGRMLYVSSSIGISLHPQDAMTAHNLLKYADTAMYRAKDEGRNNYQFYSSEMTELAFERVAMEVSLREALKNEEFVVHYQPQFDASSQTIIGVEALVRWQHPSMGLVSPAKFIPLAEETGLIVKIDQLVMKAAIDQVNSWYKQGLAPGVLALNLAVKQLERDDFLQTLKDNMELSGFKPEWLELEVTEGQVMQKPEEAIVRLRQINELGIEIAIDDFGTGYSSLSYLKRLPIKKLKIDQSFVKDLPDDDDDVAIVKAIIALAKSLNLDLLGEGVETAAQKDFLLNNGCKNIQGYYYARPMPADEMRLYLQKDKLP